MNEKFLGIPLFIWSALCLGVAIIFIFVWPSQKAVNAIGLRYLILRWGHSLVWLLLALFCFVRGSNLFGAPNKANIIALLALPTYLIYLFTIITA